MYHYRIDISIQDPITRSIAQDIANTRFEDHFISSVKPLASAEFILSLIIATSF